MTTIKARMPVDLSQLSPENKRNIAKHLKYLLAEPAARSLVATLPGVGPVFVQRDGKVFHD